jgi:small subunit ribosomal protein S1
LSGIDPSQPANFNPTEQPSTTPAPADDSTQNVSAEPVEGGAESDAARLRQRILIGSQRDPAAYRARRQRDWEPVAEETTDGQGDAPAGEEAGQKSEHSRRRRHRGGQHRHDSDRQPGPQQATPEPVAAQPPVAEASAPVAELAPPPVVVASAAVQAQDDALRSAAAAVNMADIMSVGLASSSIAAPAAIGLTGNEQSAVEPIPSSVPAAPPTPKVASAPVESGSLAVPSRRDRLSPEMESELAMAMGDVSFEDLMMGGSTASEEAPLEPESRHRGRVVAVRRDDVFIELGGRAQGCISLRAFPEPPQPGAMLEVIVQRLNAEDGLYDLGLPGASVDVGNWDDVQEGMQVEVQVTGHNTGGLECEVNHIRAFIPVSQIALYRVEDLAQFVGQRFTCLITEANPMRRNLVLSRRAVLEREQEQSRQQFYDALAPGQIYEGTVRKLMDFGAFVELGNGVDGLLHVSQLSWGRIGHPKEVLTEGQPIRVKIEKVDHATGRIGLAYRDMLDNPWTTAASKYPSNAIARGKVTKLMEFGAFVELEPGIEGLIHISELSHKRVWRASDVVHEGDEVEVLVLNVNTEAQRMSLSIKALSKPEPTKKEKEAAQEAEAAPLPKKQHRPSNGPLRGGLGKPAGGEKFGLNW